MPELLNENIKKALETLNQSFVYRKLGCCYDYRMPPGADFNLNSLPKAAEISKNIPEETGIATGMYDCVLNNALLFDGLAARFEIGFADESEYMILDRLIGGAIRLATIAPKNLIIRGLSADGRYFYNHTDTEVALLWHFTAWRTITTSTVTPASQAKLVNIATRWLNNFASKDYILSGHDKAFDSDNDLDRLRLAAILAFYNSLTPKEEIQKSFELKFNQDFTIPTGTGITGLLTAQLSLQMIQSIYTENPIIQQRAQSYMQAIAVKAEKFLQAYTAPDATLLEETADPDWRNFSSDAPTVSQQKYADELQKVTTVTQAMHVILYSQAEDLIKENAPLMAEIISLIPWEKLSLASALTAVISAHARGIELELWDKELHEFVSSFIEEKSLVAQFMTEDYDEKNPAKAGHTQPPVKKKPPELLPESTEKKSSKKRRGKNRKTSKTGGKNQQNRRRDKPNTNSGKDKGGRVKEGKEQDNKNSQPTKTTKKKRNRRRRPRPGNKRPENKGAENKKPENKAQDKKDS